MDAELGKLRWRCRRGMKELDVLLTRYVDERYPTAGAAQQADFRRLLEVQDPVLHGYFLGREAPVDPALAVLVAQITAVPAKG